MGRTDAYSAPPLIAITYERLRYLNRSHTVTGMAQAFGSDPQSIEAALELYGLQAASLSPGSRQRQPRNWFSKQELSRIRQALLKR